MSKTDGIGTWVWNDSLNIPQNLFYQTDSDTLTPSYKFSFICNEVTFSGMTIASSSFVPGVRVFYGDKWIGNEYKIIHITSAPPAEFMTILTANATYQESAPDYTGKYLDGNGLRDFATKVKEYVDGQIGDIGATLDLINGEVV